MAIHITDLDFTYPGARAPLFRQFSLHVPAGSRCLLLGQNGVGKTTLLRLLGGKHMVPREAVRVLSASAFHDTALCRRVAFLGGPFPFDVDLRVDEILAPRCGGDDPGALLRRQRAERLLDVLEIERDWHMHRLSAGQRRRVQVLLGLLEPVEVVLLDEVTADLDVLSRADLLSFLLEESQNRGVTIVYATHILDGLQRWATHLCFLSPQADRTSVRVMAPIAQVPELQALSGTQAPLLSLCERWLRQDRQVLRADQGRGS